MRMLEVSESAWAHEELFSARLPDRRHVKRAISMLTGMAHRPAGRVLDVFETSAERQGAYDLLENAAIRPDALSASISEATVMRAGVDGAMFVAVDGSSATLTDKLRTKDFGSVGANAQGGRGLKVINAYGVSTRGVPLGLTAQVWWARKSVGKRRQDHQKRKLADKETSYWCEAIDRTIETVTDVAPHVRLCLLLDREGDGLHTLAKVGASGHDFIVRSSHNRRLESRGNVPRYLRDELAKTQPRGTYQLPVLAGPGRTAREANMVVRFGTYTLRMRDKVTGAVARQPVTAVSARETATTPRGEAPLHWILLTNRVVSTLEEACALVYGYSLRWRIEEFHRTWKSGACEIEGSQLRKKDHFIKWATLMAAVAARIERLKVLARTEPSLPASIELNPYEIKALVLNRRRTKKRTDPVPSDHPTVGEAVRWLADIGGYTGKSSGGPPGSITIRRGFDRIVPVALALEQLEKEGKLR
jgi:hypothetical protein